MTSRLGKVMLLLHVVGSSSAGQTVKSECPSSFGRCIDADSLLVSAEMLKLDITTDLGKQSVISSSTYIHSRMEFCPALANKDATSRNILAPESFHPEALCVAVATVP